ncbi:MAG: hypothetical protein KC931_25005, partial [Candidatus Omnitrophica bacterium]|nr:hypothetical protein [Candidatus Omnitrophota bacterium]
MARIGSTFNVWWSETMPVEKKFNPIPLVLAALAIFIYFFFWRVGEPAPDLARSAPIRAALESGDPQTWVAIGDSITAGTNSPFRYTDRVEEILRSRYPRARLEFQNAGVPGDTASGGLNRLERDVLSRNPDVVFVEFGWNDFKNGVKPEDFESDLSQLVGQLKAGGIPVIYLLTTTQVDVALANWKIKKRNAIIRDIAEENDCGLIDLYGYFALATQKGSSLDDLMSNDNIHPSGAGQDVIAQAIAREFIP